MIEDTGRPGGRGPGAGRLPALVLCILLAGCGADDTSTQGSATAAGAQPSTSASHEDDTHGDAAGALPSSHVHGVAVNPGDDRVYLATHEGLYRYDEDGTATRVGPVIDLMGFSIAGPDHFYASGHPGPGVDLPQPVGLIESKDAGRTWSELSRQGESDFHALTASEAGVIGFDGTLRASSDGETWHTLDAPAEVYSLAASPDGRVILGTNESGLLRSSDAGKTWAAVPATPQLMLVDWASAGMVVGVAPDGTVATSDDAGLTWSEGGSTGGRPQAIGAAAMKGSTGSTSKLDVLVVTDTGLLRSTDGGTTFSAYPARS